MGGNLLDYISKEFFQVMRATTDRISEEYYVDFRDAPIAPVNMQSSYKQQRLEKCHTIAATMDFQNNRMSKCVNAHSNVHIQWRYGMSLYRLHNVIEIFALQKPQLRRDGRRITKSAVPLFTMKRTNKLLSRR